jgi:hypothetical protein
MRAIAETGGSVGIWHFFRSLFPNECFYPGVSPLLERYTTYGVTSDGAAVSPAS